MTALPGVHRVTRDFALSYRNGSTSKRNTEAETHQTRLMIIIETRKDNYQNKTWHLRYQMCTEHIQNVLECVQIMCTIAVFIICELQ